MTPGNSPALSPLPVSASTSAHRRACRQGEEFFLVVDHFVARLSGQRVVLLQEDRLLRADFLAVAAEDASEHVDLEFEAAIFSAFERSAGDHSGGRRDPDGLGRTDEFAELAGDTLGIALLIATRYGAPR